MSIPYNDNLKIDNFPDPDWYKKIPAWSPTKSENQIRRAAGELCEQAFKQSGLRAVQLIRDVARLVLKVPYRAIRTPICLQKNWQERERAIVNVKLPGYAFIQLASVPFKFVIALIALATSFIFQEKAKWLLDKSEEWTAHFDGRASQLEALKEEGAKKGQRLEEFKEYRTWLYGIDPKLCRRECETLIK